LTALLSDPNNQTHEVKHLQSLCSFDSAAVLHFNEMWIDSQNEVGTPCQNIKSSVQILYPIFINNNIGTSPPNRQPSLFFEVGEVRREWIRHWGEWL
jgi:hypothetical protein